MKAIKYLFLLVSALSIFSSCQKSNNPITDEEINVADDEFVTELVFDDIFSSADNAAQMLDGISKGMDEKSINYVLADSCPMVTVDISDELIRTITIDYGEGCEGFYDRVRSGKIIIVVTGPRRETGSTRTVTLENYYFNGVRVEGTWFTENIGLNDNENTVFMSSLTGGKLFFPNDIVTEREFTHYREFVAGYYTPNIWDDECLITGSATGVTYRGISFENTIVNPLHWKRACHFFVSGVIEMKREGAEAFKLDYGDGECDAIAIISRGDQEKEIILSSRHRLLR